MISSHLISQLLDVTEYFFCRCQLTLSISQVSFERVASGSQLFVESFQLGDCCLMSFSLDEDLLVT